MRQGRVGRVRVHGGGDAVDGLVAAGAQDCSTENPLCLGIDRDLHETQRLAFFDRAADPGHRPPPAQDGPSRIAGLLVGHADAPERWIDEQAVGDDAVGDAARFFVQQIGRDDLGLAAAGVRCDPRGYIVTDEFLRTNVPGIWALGDCNGRGAASTTVTALPKRRYICANSRPI